MDVKVYKKEAVRQPSGYEYVYTPDVIDIIPEIIETESKDDVQDGVWSLNKLKRVADVNIENNKLIINSDNVRVEDGKLVVRTTNKVITGCETVDNRDELEQQCALATIFQRGLDPLAMNDGVRWSEAILGEISPIQLMDDLSNAVTEVTTMVSVVFDTITDASGKSYLTYSLKEIA